MCWNTKEKIICGLVQHAILALGIVAVVHSIFHAYAKVRLNAVEIIATLVAIGAIAVAASTAASTVASTVAAGAVSFFCKPIA